MMSMVVKPGGKIGRRSSAPPFPAPAVVGTTQVSCYQQVAQFLLVDPHVGDYAAGVLAEPNVRQLHLGAYRGTPDSPAPTAARQRLSGPVGFLGGLGFGDRGLGAAKWA